MKTRYKQWIAMAAGWLTLIGCSEAMDPLDPSPAPEEARAVLPITVAVGGSAVQTKAADSHIAAGDVLYAYIRQVKGTTKETAQSVNTEVETWAKLTVTAASTVRKEDAPKEEQTSSFRETYYWDDFSTTAYDLRETDRALQSYYGYCYNGNTGSFTPNADEGKLTWTVAADQTSDGFQTSDLLWSQPQQPVVYNHDKNNHGTLIIPYTHAMSKVTLVVKIGDGFTAASPLAKTTAVLQQVYTSGEMNAPAGTVNPTDGSKAEIQMRKQPEGSTFEALMIPGLELTEGLVLAQVNDVAGNNYSVPITSAILTGWKSQLTGGTTTQPGVNYKLTVTVKKQQVEIVATLADWTNVEAAGDGRIQFANDVTDITGTTGTALSTGSEVDIFWVKQGAEAALATVQPANYSTTSIYQADAKWVNNPAVYWDNGVDNYYFRGLAEQTEDGIKSYKKEPYSFAVAQGTDLLWATTPEHSGTRPDGSTHTYAAGAALHPRTSQVPLHFEHAMSRVTFKLQTTTGADHVYLAGATLSLADVIEAGTIEPATGRITPSADNKAALTAAGPTVVIPQTVTDAMVLTLQLRDPSDPTRVVATYKINLNTCKPEGSTEPVKAWEPGKHYTYTITLKKEAVQLIAFVKDWIEVKVSGDADLDWDD